MIFHQLDNSADRRHYNAYIYENWHWTNHFHKCYELIYAMHDNVCVTLNGTRETLSKGEFLLIYPYTVHQFDITKAWVGVFSEDYVQSFADKKQGIAYARFFCDADVEEFLKRRLLNTDTPTHYMLKSCLYMVCSELIGNATVYDSKVNPSLIERLTEYITENLTKDVTLETVAQTLGYEYHYVSKLFHELFHMNFKEYVNLYRFQLACDMLIGSDKSITDVAIECGFQSIRNFNRVFKTFADTTPGEFRKLKSKTEE